MEPAQSIISKFGSARAVAKIVGVHRTRIHAWKRPKDRGGTGGSIPMGHAEKLLDAAKERGIDLSPEHFFLKK